MTNNTIAKGIIALLSLSTSLPAQADVTSPVEAGEIVESPLDAPRGRNASITDSLQEGEGSSSLFVESDSCSGDLVEACSESGPCFDHTLACTEDGSMLFEQSSTALPFCKPCFPNSRCGVDEENVSASFVESESCGPEFATCVEAAACFDHNMGCGEDGATIFPECSPAMSSCKTCFPNSRCSRSNTPVKVPPEDGDASGLFVESERCGPTFASCTEASACFDHSMGCAEDGSIIFPECSTALPFCEPCFPNSRCGSGDVPADEEKIDEETSEEKSADEEEFDEEVSEEESQDAEISDMEAESGADRLGMSATILALIVVGILWY